MSGNPTKPVSIWTAPRKNDVVFIGGHRGSSFSAPENTAAAFELAIAEGADFIETDLRLTRDGIPVAFHDSDLQRLHGDKRSIDQVDLAELRSIRPSTVTIMEALDAVAGCACVLLDTKIEGAEPLCQSIELLRSWLGNGTVAFGTRSLEASRIVRQNLPACPVLGLYRDYRDYADLAASGGQWARLWQEDASSEAIAGLHELGLKVIIMAGKPSTVEVGLISQERLTELLQWRPDAVMLNDVKTGIATRDAHIRHGDFT